MYKRIYGGFTRYNIRGGHAPGSLWWYTVGALGSRHFTDRPTPCAVWPLGCGVWQPGAVARGLLRGGCFGLLFGRLLVSAPAVLSAGSVPLMSLGSIESLPSALDQRVCDQLIVPTQGSQVCCSLTEMYCVALCDSVCSTGC